MSEDIKSPREAAEYFCWVAGKDEQIEALAFAFEARDNYWQEQLRLAEAVVEAARNHQCPDDMSTDAVCYPPTQCPLSKTIAAYDAGRRGP